MENKEVVKLENTDMPCKCIGGCLEAIPYMSGHKSNLHKGFYCSIKGNKGKS